MRYSSTLCICVSLLAAFLLSTSHVAGESPPEPPAPTQPPTVQPNKTTQAPGTNNSTDGTGLNVTEIMKLGTDLTTIMDLTSIVDMTTPDVATSAPKCDNSTENCTAASSTPAPQVNSTASMNRTDTSPDGTVMPETDKMATDGSDIPSIMPTDLPTDFPKTDALNTDLPGPNGTDTPTVAPDTTSNATPTGPSENPGTSTPSRATPVNTKAPTKAPTGAPTEAPTEAPPKKPTEPAEVLTTGTLTTKPDEPNKNAVHHGNTSVVVGLVVTALLLILIVGVVIYFRQRRLRNNYGRLNEETEDSGWSAFSKNPIYRGDRNEPYL